LEEELCGDFDHSELKSDRLPLQCCVRHRANRANCEAQRTALMLLL